MVDTPLKVPSTAQEAVLSKAVVRAAQQLGLRQSQLARILGLSAASASRLSSGGWQIPAASKTWELATALVRLYRSLSALTGGQQQAMRDWLHSDNQALGGSAPASRILSAEGLIHVLQYLDAARGRI
ncbi:MAG TPA: MbcA/ParS/Xre antitoxin family protein [Steroidobacteraceae bacterium]|nr:MbcA/ParS/Xre antitoxin family protein [Steroidobacteraceae bacterium]